MAVRLLGLTSLGKGWSVTASSVFRNMVVSESWLKRLCSGQSGSSTAGEDAASDGDRESERMRGLLDQALLEIRIQSAAPAWLPLFPGGSFWVHPDQITEKRPKKLKGPLLDPPSDMEVLAMVMPMGWPCATAAGDALKAGENTVVTNAKTGQGG